LKAKVNFARLSGWSAGDRRGAMLIWLNGAHGAGKTTVARRLTATRPGLRLIDPERIGFMLRRLWPGGGPADFQNLPAWRALTRDTLRALAADPAVEDLVVPMTLAYPDHFREIVGGLSAAGVDVRHFTLMASLATLRRRLRWRLDWPASRRWPLSRIEPCHAALRDDLFRTHVDTDGRRVSEIADDILDRVSDPRSAASASG
jgi:chloramphenicol 3-O-phosphotransferase